MILASHAYHFIKAWVGFVEILVEMDECAIKQGECDFLVLLFFEESIITHRYIAFLLQNYNQEVYK